MQPLNPLSLVEAIIFSHSTYREAWKEALKGTPEQAQQLREMVYDDLKAFVLIDEVEAPLLHHASAKGDKWGVRTLLALGADPHATDRQGDLAVQWAIRKDQWEVFRVLWGMGLPERPPTAAPTLIHDAVAAGPRYLNKIGEDPLVWPVSIWDGWDSHGRRPLHIAADANNHNVAQQLLAMGSRHDMKDGQGRTPLERHQERYPFASPLWEEIHHATQNLKVEPTTRLRKGFSGVGFGMAGA